MEYAATVNHGAIACVIRISLVWNCRYLIKRSAADKQVIKVRAVAGQVLVGSIQPGRNHVRANGSRNGAFADIPVSPQCLGRATGEEVGVLVPQRDRAIGRTDLLGQGIYGFAYRDRSFQVGQLDRTADVADGAKRDQVTGAA